MIALQFKLVEAVPRTRTKLLVLLLALVCLSLAGCKKDAEARTLINDFDSFTDELVKRVDSASSPADGIDAAQKYFDSKKAEMTTRMDTLKGLRGYQVGNETKKMLESNLVEDARKVATRLSTWVLQCATRLSKPGSIS
jgi:ABC-type uncharacterized transport system auxiliary subunit